MLIQDWNKKNARSQMHCGVSERWDMWKHKKFMEASLAHQRKEQYYNEIQQINLWMK